VGYSEVKIASAVAFYTLALFKVKYSVNIFLAVSQHTYGGAGAEDI
jgi:hypothetical protein